MSIVLMIAAAYLPPEVVTASEKLTLMKLADSADDDTRLAVPTQRRLVAWVGVSEKRVSTIITGLVAKGLVERVATAREGRAGVYRVFPDGVPVTPAREELDERLLALRGRPTNPRLARTPEQPRKRPSPPARTYEDVQRRALEAGGVNSADSGAGSGRAVASENTRGFREGNPQECEGKGARVSPGKPSGFREGNRQGFAGETPSFPSPRTSSPASTTPPTPTADAAGEPAAAQTESPDAAPGCPKHPGLPGANCRGCGTTVRAVRQRQKAAAAERLWETEAARNAARRREREEITRRRDAQPESYDAALQAAREAFRQGRGAVGGGQ
ncbi:hypothetical protein GCM10009612_14080 [Streptomyces beijiangensis]